MMNKIKILRLCFERTFGADINNAEDFVRIVGNKIDDGTGLVRFGGYIILDTKVLTGLHGAPCWQYIIDGDFDSETALNFVNSLKAPRNYVIHIFAKYEDYREILYKTI